MSWIAPLDGFTRPTMLFNVVVFADTIPAHQANDLLGGTSRLTFRRICDPSYETFKPLIDSSGSVLFASKIDLDDFFVVLHLIHRAFAKNRPLMENGHLAAICRTNTMSCSITTTLCLPARLMSSSPVLAVSSSVMPAAGSSTSKKLRILRQQHADLEPLLLPVSERTSFPGGFIHQVDGGKDLVNFSR